MGYFISILTLLFSVQGWTQINTYQMAAEDSKTTAELLISKTQGQTGYIHGISNNAENVDGENISVNLKGSFDEQFKYRGGLSFIKRTISANEDNYTISGLSDLNFSAWGLVPFETHTFNYGFDTQISASPARYTVNHDESGYARSMRWKNNFSGYNTYSIFAGSEFIIGKVNMGVRGSYLYYQSRLVQEETYLSDETNRVISEDLSGVGVDGYMEIPLHKAVKVGIAAGTATARGNAQDILFGKADDSLYSKIYGTYQYDNETSFIGAISSQSKNVYYSSESTDLTVGVARSL